MKHNIISIVVSHENDQCDLIFIVGGAKRFSDHYDIMDQSEMSMSHTICARITGLRVFAYLNES